MLVNEIFNSIEGEGKRAGELTTFVRFNGCNLRCKYCDTKYSWGNDGKEYTLSELMECLQKTAYKNITLTGGEPLIQPDIDKLIKLLLEQDFNINIETNGTIDGSYLRKMALPNPLQNVGTLFFTMDYKTASSNEESKMLLDNFLFLDETDVLKFVVGSKDELINSLSFINDLRQEKQRVWKTSKPNAMPIIYFSPIFGSIEAKDIVDFMKEYELVSTDKIKYRVQLQLHKYIWEPNKRGV